MSDSIGVRFPRGIRSPLGRMFGSVASWFLFALCFTLLLLSMSEVLGMGGFCARGGPYVIAHECSDAVALFAPLSIYGGLLAVAIALILSGGFGVSLLALAWPVLFCGLGTGFLLAVVYVQDWTPLILGVVFWTMGLVPLLLSLRNRPTAVLLGSVNLRGEQFINGDRGGFAMLPSKTPPNGGSIVPSLGSWLLSVACCAIPIAAGCVLALRWFAAVGGQ